MVSGFDYPATENVEVYFQDKANGVISTTTNAGGFFNVPLKLPKKYINETAYVYAVSDGSTTKTLLKFAKPTLSSTATAKSSTATAKSTRTSFTGTGFLANKSLQLVLSNGNKIVKTETVRTDSQGHLALTLTLPSMPFGSKPRLTLNSPARKAIASTPVDYSPIIYLNSFAGSINNRIGIEGKYFARGERVVIEFQDGIVGIVRADRYGSFFTLFTVPSWATRDPYENDVQAIGLFSRASAAGSFQVLPSVSFNTNTGLPGQQVAVTGSQFTPGRPVQVLFFSPSQGDSSVGTLLETPGVSSDGTFRGNFTIPDNTERKKVYSIVYIDVASGLNVTTYFKVQ